MRVGVVNGNGYECDICHTLLEPSETIKIHSKINVDSTGRSKVVDSIGVCEDCYKNHFKILYGRGLLRQNTKGEKIRRKKWKS